MEGVNPPPGLISQGNRDSFDSAYIYSFSTIDTPGQARQAKVKGSAG